MNTVIACFSGTGNSWYVAQKLQASIEDSQVLLIPELIKHPQLLGNPDQLGIVFPVYDSVPPPMVALFISKVLGERDMQGLEYLFLIATCNGKATTALAVGERLCMYNGIMTSYAAKVVMPDTNTFLTPVADDQRQLQLFQQADAALESISKDLNAGELKLPPKSPFIKLFMKTKIASIETRIRQLSSHLVVTDACTGCKTCYKGCPGENITMKEGKPSFGTSCEGCLGCYHRCPSHAIAFDKEPKAGYSWYPNKQASFKPIYRK